MLDSALKALSGIFKAFFFSSSKVVPFRDCHALFFFSQNSVPIEVEVIEELALGTKIAEVKAVDNDEGDNAVIDYAIIGNVTTFFIISLIINF